MTDDVNKVAKAIGMYEDESIALVTGSLSVVTYLDSNGSQRYLLHHQTQLSLSSLIGLLTMAQHDLLEQARAGESDS